MLLLLLIILAVVLWLILAELEPEHNAEEQIEAACPACHRGVDIDWMVCPHCQQRLREACVHCHKGKLINHQYCPFCGLVQEGTG